MVDRGNEFLAKFREMIINDYGIMVRPITSRNPQANAIVERVHQSIGNILRSFKVQNMILDDENPWDGILASTMCALRATLRTTTQYTYHDLDWETTRKQKQDLINEGNKHENRNQINLTYKKGDVWKTKFNQDAYIGPYVITAVRNNGTVKACKGRVTDTFNIRNLSPYKE